MNRAEKIVKIKKVVWINDYVWERSNWHCNVVMVWGVIDRIERKIHVRDGRVEIVFEVLTRRLFKKRPIRFQHLDCIEYIYDLITDNE